MNQILTIFSFTIGSIQDAAKNAQYSKRAVSRIPSIFLPLLNQFVGLVKTDKNVCSDTAVGSSISYLPWLLFLFKATIRQFVIFVYPSTQCQFEKRSLLNMRAQNEASFTRKQPEDYLVSILIPTFNRAELLVERAIPSALRQTHKNIEIIIVGDHCTDNTEERVKEIHDKRLRMINLQTQGIYPKERTWRWQVAGTKPVNVALDLSKGDWIAHLDDDDVFSPDHVEVLLDFALKNNLEMAYGVVERETSKGQWVLFGTPKPGIGSLTRPSAIYRNYLKFFKWDVESWRLNEPGDGNLWKRMILAGVKIGFLPRIVGKCYFARNINKKLVNVRLLEDKPCGLQS
jgi:hypothetical protein